MRRPALAVCALLLLAAACGEQQVVQGNRPPELKLPGAQLVREGELLAFSVTATDPDDDLLTLTVAGLPEGAQFETQSGQVLWTPGFQQGGQYSLSFSVTDGKAAAGGVVLVIVVESTRPPVFQGLSEVVGDEGASMVLVVLATDPDEDAVSVGAQGIPQGADFEAQTGLFTWLPRFDQAGTYVVIFSATELTERALTARFPVRITVRDLNRAPVFEPLPEIDGKEGRPIEISIGVGDPDGDPVDVVAAVPPGATFDPTSSHFSWTPIIGQARNYNVPFTATDRHLPAANALTAYATLVIRVARANRVPTLDALTDAVLAEKETLTVFLSGHDEDSDQTLTYSAVGKPPDARLEGQLFTWTPGCNAAGTYTVLFTVSDGLDSASRRMEIAVNNTNCPPRIGAFDPSPVREGLPLTFVVPVDDEDVEGYQFSVAGAPGAAIDPTIGLFTWTPDYDQGGDGQSDYAVVFTVRDRGYPPLQDSVTEIITVLDHNRVPVFDPVGSQTVFEQEVVSILVLAHDPDGDAITDILVSGEPFSRPGSDAKVALQAVAGGLRARFTWKPTCTDGGLEVEDYFLTFTAKDAKGGEGNALTAVSVKNVDCAPILTVDPLSDTRSELDTVTIHVTAEDPDGYGIFRLLATGGPMAGSHPNDGVRNRRAEFVVAGDRQSGTLTWTTGCRDEGDFAVNFTVRDGTGHEVSKQAGIEIKPTVCPPTLALPEAVQGQEASDLGFTVQADDPASATAPLLSWSGLPPGACGDQQGSCLAPGNRRSAQFAWKPGCTQTGSYAVTYTAAGLEATVSGTVNVEIANVNCAPVFDPVGGPSVNERQPAAFTVVARDPDGDALSDLWVSGDPFLVPGSDAAVARSRESDSVRALFTWLPSCRDGGASVVDYPLQFQTQDPLGLVSSATVTVRVWNVDCAPLITVLPHADSTSELGFLTIDVEATDPDGLGMSTLAAGGGGINGYFGYYYGGDPEWSAFYPDDGVRHRWASFQSDPGAARGTYTWSPGCQDAGQHDVRLVAYDATVRLGTTSTRVTVTPTACLPRLTLPDAVSGEEDRPLSYLVTVDDPEAPYYPPPISWSGLPPGACGHWAGSWCNSMPSGSALFLWTPACNQAGAYAVTYTAAGAQGSVSGTVRLAVRDVNCGPRIDPPQFSSYYPWIWERQPETISVFAHDPDGDAVSTVLVSGPPFSRPGSNAAVSLESASDGTVARFSWTPTCQDGASTSVIYPIEFLAIDSQGAENSLSTNLEVINVDCAPEILLDGASEHSVHEQELLTLRVEATDPDGVGISSLTVSGGPLSPWWSYDGFRRTRAVLEGSDEDDVRTVRWTPGCQDANADGYWLDIHAEDATGQNIYTSRRIRVFPTDCPLALRFLPDGASDAGSDAGSDGGSDGGGVRELAQPVTAPELGTIRFRVIAEDPEREPWDTNNQPRITWSSAPRGACPNDQYGYWRGYSGGYFRDCGSYSPRGQAPFRWRPDCSQSGSYRMTYTASAADSGSDSGSDGGSDSLRSVSRDLELYVTNVNCPPTFTGIVPWTAPEEGGRMIRLCGANLVPGTTIFFDGASEPVEVFPFSGDSVSDAGTDGACTEGLRFLAPALSAPAVVQVSVDNHQGTPLPGPRKLHYYRLREIGGIDWGTMRAVAGSTADTLSFASLFERWTFTSSDGGASWTRRGHAPPAGAVDFLLFESASDPALYHVGGGAGYFPTQYQWTIHRSTDRGQSWADLTGSVPSLPCGATSHSQGPPPPYVDAAPAQGGGILVLVDKNAGCGRGLWRSPQSGQGWRWVHGSPETLPTSNPSGQPVSYLAVATAPSDRRHLFVSLDDLRTFRSSDGGDSWTETARVGALVRRAAFDPEDSRHLFALSFFGLRESTDFGDTWIERSGFSGLRDLAVTRDPGNPQATIYVLGATEGSDPAAEASTDNGQTVFRRLLTGFTSSSTYLAATPGYAVAGCALSYWPGGYQLSEPPPYSALRTTNGGMSWVDASANLSSASVDRLVVTQAGGLTALSGGEIYASLPPSGPGPRWFARTSADISGRYIHDLVASESGSDTVFALDGWSLQPYRSLDTGMNFANIGPGGYKVWLLATTPGKVHALATTRRCPDSYTDEGCPYYEQYDVRMMLTSTDDGASWTEGEASSDFLQTYRARLHVDRVRTNYLWVFRMPTYSWEPPILLRSSNNGRTFAEETPSSLRFGSLALAVDRYAATEPWERTLLAAGTQIPGGSPVIAFNQYGGTQFGYGWFPQRYPSLGYWPNVTAFGQLRPAPSPEVEEDVFLAAGRGGLTVSTDRGVTWRRLDVLDDLLPIQVTSIQQDGVRGDTLYLGTKEVSYPDQLAAVHENPGPGAGVWELRIILP